MNRQVSRLAKAVLAPQTAMKTVARSSSAYKPSPNWFDPHMNELPLPQGSWQASYDAAQTKNNMQLLGGISFFIFTLVVMKTSGLVVLNATIPSLPELDEK